MNTVLCEIFDLRFKPNDVTLNHFLDDIEGLNFTVSRCHNYDHAIVIIFYRPGSPSVNGEIRIDRIRRTFDISVKIGAEVVLPVSGDWDLILECLTKVG